MRPRGPLVLVCLGFAACGGEAEVPVGPATPPAQAASPTPPVFEDPALAAGRSIWMDTCQGCHDIGIAGAPKLGDGKAWAPRIAQGKAVLYEHAINGHFGPTGTMMPPRGGNDALSDEEVKAAVDYMVAASR